MQVGPEVVGSSGPTDAVTVININPKPTHATQKRNQPTMSLFKNFKTDPNAEKNGVLIEYGEFRLRLARIGGSNTDFAKRYEELMKPYRRVPKDQLKADVQEKIVTTVFTETVIKPNTWQTLVDGEWVDGIESESGEIIPATAENMAKILLELPDLYNALFKEANSITNFLAEARQEDAKNS